MDDGGAQSRDEAAGEVLSGRRQGPEGKKFLDEIVELTGWHRDHARG